MVLVRMKHRITGSRNGEPWPLVGGDIDLPEDEAKSLEANGYAQILPDPEPEKTPAKRGRGGRRGKDADATGDPGDGDAGGSDASAAGTAAKGTGEPGKKS